jgi:hypothetical protein
VRVLAPTAIAARPARVRALQRRVGNRAVTRLLARAPADDARELEGILEVASDLIEEATGSRPPPGTSAAGIQNALRRVVGKRGKHAEAAKRLAQQIQEIRNRAKFVPKAKPAGAAAKAEEKAAETVGKAEEKAAETVVKAEGKAAETVVKMEGKAAETVVKAEVKAGARLASRAGRLALSALLPGPEDAIMLMYEFAGSYKEAWEIIEERYTRRGIAMGIAAGMLGLDFKWVEANLWRRFVSADVATQVIGAVGKAERAYNDGLVRGHKYGAGHPRSLKNQLLGEAFAVLAAEGYQTDEEQLFSVDTVARVAHVLTPIADDFLRQAAERRAARERREAKELKESGCVGFKC